MKKKNPNEKMIRIEANSSIYAVHETVPESKAVKRLERILETFKRAKQRICNTPEYRQTKLKVTTTVINPTLL